MKFCARIFLLCLLGACSKKEKPAPSEIYGREYYPLKEGRYNIFECDSTVYTEIPRDTIRYRYQIKEVLASAFTDDAGKEAWRLERYIRMYNGGSYDSIPWTIKDVWQVNMSDRALQVVEENIRFTKLSFPVQQGAAWNGEASNSGGEVEYRYDYVDNKESFGPITLDRTLKVLQRDFRTLISYEHGSEKYAAGVGLVSKTYTSLFSNNIVPGQAVEQRIEKGITFTQTLVSHGYQ